MQALQTKIQTIMKKIDLGTRTANLRAAYSDLKDGYTIVVGELKMWIYTCERWGSPSYGKDYICYCSYGRSASTVNFKSFADAMRRAGEGKLAYSREW